MAGIINYKQKYEELKSRFMSAVDAAWNDGFQHGMESSQLDQAQQALAGPEMDPNGQPTEGAPQDQAVGTPSGQESPATPSNNPNQDELGTHIEKLESMLGKAEISSSELGDLKKTLNDIRSLQVQINLTKSMETIKNTKLAKSLSFSPKNKANLSPNAQKTLTTQHDILKGVFAKWENESKQASSDISSILGIEGLTKKE